MSQSKDKQPSTMAIKPYGLRDVSAFYSHVTQPTGPSTIVTIAGQVGSDIDGNVPEDYVEQVQLACDNLQRCLEAAGACVQDILKLTYYIVNYDPSNLGHRGPLFAFLNGHRPASTLIPLTALASPKYLFEIEAIVAVPQSPMKVVDVVVVGAGLSGLQAAHDIQKAGLTCVVLEARDRVGGKTWSREVPGGKADVGAAWINDTNQSKMFALAQRFGLETVVQNTKGDIVIDDAEGKCNSHPYGGALSGPKFEKAVEDMSKIRNLIESTCQKLDLHDPVGSAKSLGGSDLDSLTLEDFILENGGGKAAQEGMTISTRALLGVEPSEMSALYFLDYCKSGGGILQMRSDSKDGGQYLRLPQGTQSFSEGLASTLTPSTIKFLSPVRIIDQTSPQKIHVTSARGTYQCRKLILSIPTPLYSEIRFTPPLPASKLTLSQSTLLGSYCKMILIYRSPWWRTANLCGLAQSPIGPFAVTRDTSIDSTGHYSLTCFIVGKPARDWAHLSPPQRKSAVLEQIDRTFGHFTTLERPIGVEEQIWKNEQWSQGCPCPVMPPGIMTEHGKALREEFGGVHFVGTETAYEWKGYMEGAVRSGERGAEEVIKSFT